MRLKVRDIHGAYIGRHCEVVGPLGQRVYPLPIVKKRNPDGTEWPLGTDRKACEGFVAGYEFARNGLADSNGCKRPMTWQDAKEQVFCREYGHYPDVNGKCMTCGKRLADQNGCKRP